MDFKKPKRLVVKIGSNVLTMDNGQPDIPRMEALVKQLSFLRQQKIQIILVSSGAVAFGRKDLILPDKLDTVLKKQIWASAGQIELIQTYKKLFSLESIPVAQILVTKEDFRDRKHYLNMKNCLEGLISQNVLPVINENDTVAITELMFTDNDELASLTAAMVNADTLVLLTNVDGVFDGPPSDPSSKLIPYIGTKIPDLLHAISPLKSSFGRGGMLTKLNMAKKSADLGIQVVIANGKKEDILSKILQKETSFTFFEPQTGKQSPKKWLAHAEHYFKGEVIVNEGAKNALFSEKISSLLPVGIISLSGEFSKGDIIRIKDELGTVLGLGKAEYSNPILQEKLGQKNQKPFIHYDYLYIFQHD